MNHLSVPLPAEILHIEGADALTFAQAQLSSDVAALHEGGWQWSAWLDARGKIRALLQLVRIDPTHFLALLRGGRAQSMSDALRPYVMRSKVTLSARTTGCLGGAAPSPLHSVHTADGDMVLGCGDYAMRVPMTDSDKRGTAVSTSDADVHRADWHLAAIRAGHPWLPDAALEACVPQALSLERLGAVSFTKGCFPGQEIAARMHYRGGAKRHLYRVTAAQPITGAEAIFHDGSQAGLVLGPVDACERAHEALAVITDDAVNSGQPLSHGAPGPGVSLRVVQAFGP